MPVWAAPLIPVAECSTEEHAFHMQRPAHLPISVARVIAQIRVRAMSPMVADPIARPLRSRREQRNLSGVRLTGRRFLLST